MAQLGGAHVACEWVSNVLTKLLQRPRLGAYLEQSTRYIAYDAPMPGGGYRYYRDAELGPEYEAAMDALFDAYAEALPRVRAGSTRRSRARTASRTPRAPRAVNAKALDLLRGLLPAASLSHMGIYATGQAYEQLILHLMGHPLPEARAYGEMILDAIKAVMPSFVARVERPGARRRVGRLPRAPPRGRRALGRPPRARRASPRRGAAVGRAAARRRRRGRAARRAAVRGRRGGEERDARGGPRARRRRARARCSPTSSASARNRRHRPGRGFEALRYRFEVVSDYGAFRDLQRHRMLTVQWQGLTPDLGADVPEEVVAAGAGDLYAGALERSRAEYDRLAGRRARRGRARTRSASATGSATCSTSTPARRCT